MSGEDLDKERAARVARFDTGSGSGPHGWPGGFGSDTGSGWGCAKSASPAKLLQLKASNLSEALFGSEWERSTVSLVKIVGFAGSEFASHSASPFGEFALSHCWAQEDVARRPGAQRLPWLFQWWFALVHSWPACFSPQFSRQHK